jgi:hypothetical protein
MQSKMIAESLFKLSDRSNLFHHPEQLVIAPIPKVLENWGVDPALVQEKERFRVPRPRCITGTGDRMPCGN